MKSRAEGLCSFIETLLQFCTKYVRDHQPFNDFGCSISCSTFIENWSKDGEAVMNSGTVPSPAPELMLTFLDAQLHSFRHAGHDLNVISTESHLLRYQTGYRSAENGLRSERAVLLPQGEGPRVGKAREDSLIVVCRRVGSWVIKHFLGKKMKGAIRVVAIILHVTPYDKFPHTSQDCSSCKTMLEYEILLITQDRFSCRRNGGGLSNMVQGKSGAVVCPW